MTKLFCEQVLQLIESARGRGEKPELLGPNLNETECRLTKFDGPNLSEAEHRRASLRGAELFGLEWTSSAGQIFTAWT